MEPLNNDRKEAADMQAVSWNPLSAMPAGRDFELYHMFHEIWNNFAFHSHPFYEIYFFISGSVQIMVEDRLYEIQPWDMLVFPPGVMHKNTPVDNNVNYERAYFYATENFLRSVSEPECDLAEIFSHAAKNKQHHFHLGEILGRTVLEKMDGIIGKADDASAIGQLINRCQMTILLASVCEIIQNFTADSSAAVSAKSAQILHYLDQRFTQPISLDTLAGQFYISKYHLLREFKEYTGTTVHQYLIGKRVVYAQLLLQHGTTPMQAATACGFADYAGFFRAFKRLTGVSPQEYARTRTMKEMK